jgi:glycosyltransferase involved in cell wall biosynthesis
MNSFSIVLATSAGRSETLEKCLASIFAGDYPEELYEVIVIDSGVDDKGLAAIESFKKEHSNLRFYSPGWGNVGPGTARNLGIKKAQNEIVAFTDDDCTVPSNWLGRLDEGYKGFKGDKGNEGIAGVGGYLEAPAEILSTNIFAQYEKFHEWSQYNIRDQEFISTKRDEAPFETNNISYRKSVLEEVGRFDENFPAWASGEDGDLKERIVKRGYSVLFVPIKVTHLQDYNLKRFWRQQMNRGAGISLTKRKKEMRLESWPELVLKILLGPLVFFRFLAKDNFKVKFALLDTVGFVARQVGKLKIPNLKLQISNKSQIQNSKFKTGAVWNLVLGIYLVIGACDLVLF